MSDTQHSSPRLSFIGCGHMGEALLQGSLRGGFTSADRTTVSTHTPERAALLGERYEVQVAPTNAVCARDSELVVLAVKPDRYREVIREILPELRSGAILLSITPPFTLQTLRTLVERDDITVARSMPNLAASVGHGITALVEDPQLSASEHQLLQDFATAQGEIVWLREDQMAGISSLIGSSPAYLAMVLEALAEGAIELGIPAPQAHLLAAEAMGGTAALIRQDGLHPAVLRDQVCSAGGTSIVGVNHLEQGFKGALITAMRLSAQRFTDLEAEMSTSLEEEVEA